VQLTQLQDKNRKQAKQLEDNGLQLAAVLEENAKSAQQFEQVSKRASEAEQERVAGNQMEKRLRKEIDDLRSRATLLPDKLALTKPQEQQSYAAGVALGRDIQTLLAERKTWGIDPDKTTLLGGMIDSFNGHYQLSEAVLASALAESEKTVNAGRTQAVKDQQAKGESFVSEFRKKKGVKKSSAGFWYRVDYLGDEAIAETSLVDIVLKEMLTDGRVIQDMDRSGKVLSQPLSAYPPLFREAIGYLRNHGSLTMVVPPELAYGEAGYAPQIPPNATMVYELRVVDADKG
jgi:FKBP-type peptidyl-prolyl cis-trans isomerase